MTGDISGTAGSAKTRGILIEMTRPSTADTTVGDLQDAGLMIRVDTEATSPTAGNVLYGYDVEAKADNPGGSITNLYGGAVTAKSDSSAGSVGNMWALQTNVHNNAAVTDSLISADFRLMRQAATEPTAEYITRIRNASTSGGGVDAGIYFKSDYSGETDDFDYVIDMSAADVDDADIRLSNGEFISNTTDGTIAFGAANLSTTGAGDFSSASALLPPTGAGLANASCTAGNTGGLYFANTTANDMTSGSLYVCTSDADGNGTHDDYAWEALN